MFKITEAASDGVKLMNSVNIIGSGKGKSWHLLQDGSKILKNSGPKQKIEVAPLDQDPFCEIVSVWICALTLEDKSNWVLRTAESYGEVSEKKAKKMISEIK